MFKKKLLLGLILSAQVILGQTVSTITEGNFHDGLAVDSQGNVYGSDFPPSATRSVYKYDTDGNVTVFADGFISPNGIGINSQDEIYICDHYGNTVKKYDNNGTLLADYTGQFTTPAGIKPIPNTLDMLVVEYDNNSGRKIKRLAADGTVTTLYTGAPLNGPAGITFIGEVAYIANFNNRKIFRFENNALTEIAQLPSSSDPSTNFLGFLTSANDMLYATHIGNNSIYSINPTTGEFSVFSGSALGNLDGDISNATFNRPNGIVTDTANNRIYVSDAGTKNLRIIDNAFLSVKEFKKKDEIVAYIDRVCNCLILKVNSSNNNKTLVEIVNIEGKVVYNTTIKSGLVNLKVPLSNWQNSTYIVKVTQGGKTNAKKILI